MRSASSLAAGTLNTLRRSSTVSRVQASRLCAIAKPLRSSITTGSWATMLSSHPLRPWRLSGRSPTCSQFPMRYPPLLDADKMAWSTERSLTSTTEQEKPKPAENSPTNADGTSASPTLTPIPFRIYPCLSLSAIPKPSTLTVPLPQSPAIHTFTQTVRIRSRKRTRMTLAMIPVALVGGIGIGYWARRSIPSK